MIRFAKGRRKNDVDKWHYVRFRGASSSGSLRRNLGLPHPGSSALVGMCNSSLVPRVPVSPMITSLLWPWGLTMSLDVTNVAVGYRPDLWFCQMEVSLTQVIDCPIHGREYFDEMI